MPGLFDEPTPYVAASDTSRERAQREDATGEASERRRRIMAILQAAGPRGMTWREVATTTGLHHGQVSGALSVLHKGRHIIMLRMKRERCHPYIHPQWADKHHADDLIHEPAQTLAGRRTAATDDVLEALRQFINTGLRLGDVVDALRILDSITE